MDDARPISHAAEATPVAPSRTSPVDAGRLSVYAALGAVPGAIPLPWIPDTLARRVRGALVHDIAARHGLSLTVDARSILADPAGTEGQRGWLAQVALFVGKRVLGRFGPLAALPPVQSAFDTFVLGHLFNRYIETARTDRAIRIDADEARRVRRAIDRAKLHAVSVEAPRPDTQAPPEDLRDPTTAMVDSLLSAAAGVPSWIVRRLDTAFDELLASSSP